MSVTELAREVCSLLTNTKGSPLYLQIRFAKGQVGPLHVERLCSQKPRDLGVTVTGLVKVGVAFEQPMTADDLATIVVRTLVFLGQRERGPLDFETGSVRLLVGGIVALAYHLKINERRVPTEEDLERLVTTVEVAKVYEEQERRFLSSWLCRFFGGSIPQGLMVILSPFSYEDSTMQKRPEVSQEEVKCEGPTFPGPDNQLMCPVNKMEASPENVIYDNPDDDYADILEDIREHGITVPLLVMIVGEVAVIICGHRRWAVAKKLGMTSVPVTIISDSHDQLAIRQRLVTDNIKTRPKLLWAEYGECHLLLEVQEERAAIRKGDAARKSNQLRGKGENPVRDISPTPKEEKGRARDLAAGLLNLGRIGKHITGETVEKKAKVYRASLEADPEKAQRIKEAANSGNLSAAIRATKDEGAKPKQSKARKEVSETEKLGKTLKSVVDKVVELEKPAAIELLMSCFNVNAKLAEKLVTQILGENEESASA